MKTQHFFTVMALVAGFAIYAQPTSYGNLNEGNAGDGGGTDNSYFGYQAGASNTGTANVFIGYFSGFSNTTTGGNVFIGRQSGQDNTASYNTFLGAYSGEENTTGAYNTFLGHTSGRNNTTGAQNTFVGQSSGYNSNGNNNTYIGRYSGYNAVGSDNVFLGFQTGYNELGSNKLYIDNSSTSSPLIWGDFLNNILNFNGSVGINTASPAYQLQLSANSAAKPTSNVWTIASDRRLKKDIIPFTDGLNILTKINPVWFTYTGEGGMPKNDRGVGIIAQEMKEIVPYTVGSFTYTDENGHKTEYLDYDGNAITYILINAIKEQQQQNEILRQELETLKNAVYGATVKTAGSKSSGEETQLIAEGFALYQNTPNPFNKTTVIAAQLPESVQQAKIGVYNLQGIELASYPLQERGKVSVEISGGRFPSGMYLYALVADGQVIDTKKMLLTN
jgi:hypothetical protein